MSLGLLGQYGSDSDSDISDSDEDVNRSPQAATGQAPSGGNGDSEQQDTAVDITAAQTGATSKAMVGEGDPLSHGVYETNSTDSESESETEDINLAESPEEAPPSLPLPDLDNILAGSREKRTNSVFSNPYKEAEDAKLAILTRHVELSIPQQPERRRDKFKRRQKGYASEATGPVMSTGDQYFDERDSSIHQTMLKRKHRSGVSDNLMPFKKAMKHHQHVQAKERPWTVGK